MQEKLKRDHIANGHTDELNFDYIQDDDEMFDHRNIGIQKDSEEEEEKPAPVKKVVREITSESESDSDTLELNEDENILSMLDDAESEELEEKKAPKQTRNKKNFKEVVKKATKK